MLPAHRTAAPPAPASVVRTALLLALSSTLLAAREPDTVLNLWPGKPPGPDRKLEEERDFTKDSDRLIAGRRIIKLGNVSTPQVHVFQPSKTAEPRPAVIIAPGGGFNILAWDLEGTEVADYLNTLGVTGIVLKYRVPNREQEPRWRAPVQDLQRALRLARHHAESWQLDPERLGVLGFSAGGKTAAMATVLTEATYEAVDEADEERFTPDFSALIYAAQLASEEKNGLRDEVVVTGQTPPVFLAHAFDDRVPVDNALLFAQALKRHDIPCDLHVYSEGGHGYGLRATGQPVTTWHHRLADWMKLNGWAPTAKTKS